MSVYPFERFSDSAKQALQLAQEEAERAGHGYIGVEHLALGLVRVPDGLAGQALAALGVSEPSLRGALGETEAGPGERTRQMIPTSPVKRVIELAFDFSIRARRPDVTTADLLRGVLAEGSNPAAGALAGLGAGQASLEAELARLSLAGASERRRPGAAAGRELTAMAPGSRVLVHDAEPPHRLWEGRVASVTEGELAVDVPDRPAGVRLTAPLDRVHPVPTGPTFLCRYCQAER